MCLQLGGAQMLLAHGARVNVRDSEGVRPVPVRNTVSVFCAISVLLLLCFQRTPLHTVGDGEICAKLIAAGAEVDAIDKCAHS